MEAKAVPIKATQATVLTPTDKTGVSRVKVLHPNERFNLPWDRYIRLNAAAEQVKTILGQMDSAEKIRILDVGGFDGALALFLGDPEEQEKIQVEVVDAATTGGTGLHINLEDQTCAIVVAVDVLEHVPPEQRAEFLTELSRVTREFLILNFPSSETKEAQKLVLDLTGNQFIKEHVEYGLPDYQEVVKEMQARGFSTGLVAHYGSAAVWVSQFVLAHTSPEQAKATASFLVRQHNTHEEKPAVPLYDLILCQRFIP